VEPAQHTQELVQVVPLSDGERKERLERLIERLFSPDGFDRDALARIEDRDVSDR